MSDMSERPDVAEEVGKEIKKFGDDFKKLNDSFRRDLEEARTKFEELKTGQNETKTYIDAQIAALTQSAVAKYDALETKFSSKIDETADDLKTALNRRYAAHGLGGDADAAKARAQAVEFKRSRAAVRNEVRPGQGFEVNDDELAEFKAYEQAYANAWMRRDEKRWSGDEFKALTTGSDPDGGYLVPPVLSNRIITRIWETSPMRSLATVETIGTDRMEIPIDDDEVGMGWVGEEEARPETTTPVLRTQTIILSEQYAKPKVTQRLLEDAAIDLEGWLARKISDKFARTEATAFVTGNGVKRPRGILSYPAGTGRGMIRQVVSGNATALTADALVALPFQVQEAFLGNARFLMKRSTLAGVALFKDQNGQYLWSDGLRGATGMTLVGYPVSFADDMPVVAANSLSVAFGDFREAYLILDRLGITTLRDPYSSKPFVEFYSRRRVGADVVNFDSYVLLKTST